MLSMSTMSPLHNVPHRVINSIMLKLIILVAMKIMCLGVYNMQNSMTSYIVNIKKQLNKMAPGWIFDLL